MVPPVPSTGPSEISIDVINSTSATVSWKELSARDLRGNLHRYIVVVEHSGKELHRVETNKTSVQLTRLNKFSEHHIKLSAATLAGVGPFATILMMTLPSGKLLHVSVLHSSLDVTSFISISFSPRKWVCSSQPDSHTPQPHPHSYFLV